jgi:hypothetical protein
MQNRKGLTRLEVIVIIILALGMLTAFWSWGSRVRRPNRRAWCGTNLKGLGTAMIVYANDYGDNFPQLPGEGPWSKNLGFAFDLPQPDFSPRGPQSQTPRTITASWYLLVREADVSPKSFVCPRSKQKYFEGQNPTDLDITELWDFGPDPFNHVSYALHNPYGRYPVNAETAGAFPVAADMSPWFVNGDIVGPGHTATLPQIITARDKNTWRLGNSLNHPLVTKRKLVPYKRIVGPAEGQNVVYVDGHNGFERFTNCGLNNDNIYTFWSDENNPTDQDIQGGQNPTARDKQNDAKSKDDSFLAI